MRLAYIAVVALVLLAPRLHAQTAEATIAWMNENKGMLVPNSEQFRGQVPYTFGFDSLCTITWTVGARGSTVYWYCVRWENITLLRKEPVSPTAIEVRGASFWWDNSPGFDPEPRILVWAHTAEAADRFFRAMTNMATLRGAVLRPDIF